MKGNSQDIVTGIRSIIVTCGYIGEIIRKEQGEIEFYYLGDLRSIKYQNGFPVDQSPTGQEDYIFRAEKIIIPNHKPPILKGKSYPYDLVNDIIYFANGKRMILQMAETPKYKEKMGFAVLGNQNAYFESYEPTK